MTKSDLVTVVSSKAHLPKNAAEEAINIMLSEMKKALKKGEKVVVSGLGTFYVSKVADKRVVPFGKENQARVIKAHKVVNFRVGRPLKKSVW